jgi:DNA modification methylase
VDDGETIHGTQKPVECMARPIRNHGDENDAVYDPFLGSGTTLIAAEQLGRRCFGVEISPAYCDVIVQRWQNLTGKQATLEATGETLDALKARRGAA